MLVGLADWLNVDPKQFLRTAQETANLSEASVEFDFKDQEVISKYLAMTPKEKLTVRLVVEAIVEKQRCVECSELCTDLDQHDL